MLELVDIVIMIDDSGSLVGVGVGVVVSESDFVGEEKRVAVVGTKDTVRCSDSQMPDARFRRDTCCWRHSCLDTVGGPCPPLPAVGARAVSGARPVWCVSSFPSDRVLFSCLALSCQRAVPSRRARPAAPLPAPAALGPTLPSRAPLLRQLRMPLLAVGPSPALQPAVRRPLPFHTCDGART